MPSAAASDREPRHSAVRAASCRGQPGPLLETDGARGRRPKREAPLRAHKPRSGHRPLPTASRRRGEVALGVTLRRGPRARSGMDVKMQIKGVRGRGRTESVPAANRPTAPRARAALRTSAAPCWAGFSRRPSAPRASRCSHLPIAFCRADAALRCRCPGNALGCSAPASPRCSGRNAEPRRTELPLRAPRRSLSRSI